MLFAGVSFSAGKNLFNAYVNFTVGITLVLTPATPLHTNGFTRAKLLNNLKGTVVEKAMIHMKCSLALADNARAKNSATGIFYPKRRMHFIIVRYFFKA